MSESIKHECGIAFIRLKRPLAFYHQKYGTAFYGLNKLHLLMQKQRNRGQDGAGIATVKLDPKPGERYISRKRSNAQQSIKDVFEQVFWHFKDLSSEQIHDPEYLKENFPYMGEVLMGHLRYGTHGANTVEQVHPFLRPNNWMSRNLLLAGNFNMTNVDELFDFLVEELGQHPKEKADTVMVLEKIGHFLDDEVQHWFDYFKKDADYSNLELTALIAEHLDVQRMLRRAAKGLDGGFALMGILGHGDAFIMRDPSGIRPAYVYEDDEIVAVASERPAIQTVFNVNFNLIREIKPAHALIVKKDGRVSEVPFTAEKERLSCSFERIYFSRGTDRDIYLERKKLGEQLALPVMKAVDFDFENTVFSFIPNTAETAFFGFMEGITQIQESIKGEKIKALHESGEWTNEKLMDILRGSPRVEKLAVKDDKARTFITADNSRDEMVSHVYDVTYGIVRNNVDTLVLLDDSIVRGTTLRNSIIRIMARLQPKRIIIVSSAPQIRYPDCYGIDMSKMGEFVAFQALIRLIRQHNLDDKLEEIYDKAMIQTDLRKEKQKNVVQELYNLFSYDDISEKIAEIVTPPNINPSVSVIYQTLDGLHTACPNNKGDWYFSGNYPTPGGNRVVNRAFLNYMQNKNVRAY